MPAAESARMAEVVYEPRDYPDCPEGEYIAMCVKAELKPSKPSQYNPNGADKIHLRWEIMKDLRTGQEVYYIDQSDAEKKKRHYMVFTKPMMQSFGERSNVGKMFKELTGLGADCILQKTKEMRNFEGAGQKEVTVVRFDQTIFENMTAMVKVKHEEFENSMGEMQMGINVASLECDTARKYENYNIIRRLPGVPEFPELLMKKLQEGNPAAQQQMSPPMVDVAPQVNDVFPQAAPQPPVPPAQPMQQQPPMPQGGQLGPQVPYNPGIPPQQGGPVPVPMNVNPVQSPIPAYIQNQHGQTVPNPAYVQAGGTLVPPRPGQNFPQPVPSAPQGYNQQPQYPSNPPAPEAPGAPNPQAPYTPGFGGMMPNGQMASPQGTTMSDLPADWQ